MDNTKYYPELSDMAVTLSNMVTKKDWETKYWNNNTETLEGTDIQSFMYHYGNEDIEVHDMSMSYDDANVCRYAIGSHDTFLRKGKVNNKTRNVITIAIGEIPDKTAELTANLYGLLGDNEEYEEYHHIGYDITSGRILENVLRYTEHFSDRQKVFFIIGARSAGGVANLLSKKLIDKFGSSSVYGYTFNAVSTINGNMIPEGRKLPNLKYAPIMNVYNDDEMMVMFTSEETNMYKYGTNVHISLSDNYQGKVSAAFNKVHPKGYDKNMKSNVVDIINRTFNINLRGYSAFVYGMTGTDWQYGDVEFNYTSDEIKNNIAIKIHEGLSDERKEELLLFWAGLYNVSKKDSTYATFEYEAHNNVRDLEKLKNIPKDLGNDAIDSNADATAFNNAMNETGVSGVTPPSIPPSNNVTSGTVTYDRELIKIIVSAAKFYINHVPTYTGKLKTRVNKGEISYDENDLALNHLTSNLTEYIDANTDTIEYINDKKIKLTKTFDKNNKITAAKREFKIINETDNKQMYYDLYNYKPDEPILGHYKWKDIINNGNSYSVNTNFTGWDYTKDDCSGSIEFILNLRESGTNALFNKGITTDNLKSWNNDTAEALYKKGWVCYYRNDQGIWPECHGTTLEDISDKTTDIKTKGINFLQPGDLLICTEYGEFYVGGCGNDENEKYKYSVTYVDEEARTNDEKKKSGISKITAPTSFSAPNSIKAEGTFAWGSVKDEFPVESRSGQKNYFYYDTTNNVFRHCECGNEPEAKSKTQTDANGVPISIHDETSKDCKFNSRSYTVIWRKK